MEYSSQAVQVHHAARPGVLIVVSLVLCSSFGRPYGSALGGHLEGTWSLLGGHLESTWTPLGGHLEAIWTPVGAQVGSTDAQKPPRAAKLTPRSARKRPS